MGKLYSLNKIQWQNDNSDISNNVNGTNIFANFNVPDN